MSSAEVKPKQGRWDFLGTPKLRILSETTLAALFATAAGDPDNVVVEAVATHLDACVEPIPVGSFLEQHSLPFAAALGVLAVVDAVRLRVVAIRRSGQ